ncbi:multiubiquitin domain-containing protein [bacterium]|nr:multiubiquitin domain-containing protein [bacterium]
MSEQKTKADQKHDEVRIHIDQKLHVSPNPTIGEAIYKLGDIEPGLVLYREVTGNREDQPIPNDQEIIHLKDGEHFHSGSAKGKEFTIIVNGRKKVVTKKELSFNEIVALAFDPVPTGENILFTITYEGGPHPNLEGTLMPGGKVKIKDGMIFNVTQTDKS